MPSRYRHRLPLVKTTLTKKTVKRQALYTAQLAKTLRKVVDVVDGYIFCRERSLHDRRGLELWTVTICHLKDYDRNNSGTTTGCYGIVVDNKESAQLTVYVLDAVENYMRSAKYCRYLLECLHLGEGNFAGSNFITCSYEGFFFLLPANLKTLETLKIKVTGWANDDS